MRGGIGRSSDAVRKAWRRFYVGHAFQVFDLLRRHPTFAERKNLY
jgi:hypothetical protein